MTILRLLLIAALILSSQACGMKKAATSITAGILSDGMVAVESEEDTYVAKEAVLPMIKILEVFHYGDPNNKRFLGLLAKANANYAFGFAEPTGMAFTNFNMKMSEAGKTKFELEGTKIEENWRARAERFYLKGKTYGVLALSAKGELLSDIPNDKFNARIKKLGKKDVETLFWTAFAWGSYINMNRDDITVAADLPRVSAMVDRVAELNPDFMCKIASAFKGAMMVSNPFLTGMKPELAKPYFEEAMKACSGNFLMSKVMYAEWYQKTVGDKEGFKKSLEEVITSDPTKLPKQRLANELAIERAKILLKNSSK